VRILLVEDDPRIGRFLERGLREEGNHVTLVTDLAQARTKVEEAWDVWVVDRMLPDGDGLTLVREARRAGNRTPALCLTARDRVDERVEGLHGGADDYILKPFSFEELLARIAAVTRRTRAHPEELVVADLLIDLAGHRVHRGEAEIKLTAREFELLRYLAERPGRVVSRTRLLEAVWDTSHDPGTNVVDVYVSYLRAKIDKGFEPPLLHTVRGVGYVLEAQPR
jgi:two-component system OmpR family response regulator